MIRFKPEVRIRWFGPELAEALECAGLWSLLHGVDLDVNSIDDSTHGVGSLHGASLALDLDPATDRPDHTADLARFLARRLSASWDVVLEPDHVHVEYDTKRRIAAPPSSRLDA